MSKLILVPVDFSDVTDLVLDEARDLAEAMDAKLVVIHVASATPDFVAYDAGPEYIRDSIAIQLHEKHQKLEPYKDMLNTTGLDVQTMLVPGEPSKKIIDEIQRMKPDLVVMGSHGHGALYHLVTGSVSSSVIQHATCPVVIVPSKVMAARGM